ncbi:MAG: hypothetical protein MUE41_00020 [Gemmatimonadaceae bacterium]|nr:hypothetical protein [Gemmatimonadaceae bacterium]
MPRTSCSAPIAVTALLAAISVAAPRPADAQLLKGIKKAAAEAAKKKVEDKVDGTAGASSESAPAASTAATARSSAAQPDSRDRDVTITPERLSLVLAGYQDVMPVLERRARFFAQADSAERARERYDACIEKAKEAFNAMSDAQQQAQMMASYQRPGVTEEMERLQALSSAVSQRASAAVQGDRASVPAIALADSLQGLQMASAAIAFPGAAKCGKYPFMSAGAAQALSARLKNVDETGQPKQAIQPVPTDAAKAQMSKTQFGRIHERIAFWVLQQNNFFQGENVTIPFAPFTDAETAALMARKKELQPLSSALSMGLVQWTRWNTLAW